MTCVCIILFFRERDSPPSESHLGAADRPPSCDVVQLTGGGDQVISNMRSEYQRQKMSSNACNSLQPWPLLEGSLLLGNQQVIEGYFPVNLNDLALDCSVLLSFRSGAEAVVCSLLPLLSLGMTGNLQGQRMRVGAQGRGQM